MKGHTPEISQCSFDLSGDAQKMRCWTHSTGCYATSKVQRVTGKFPVLHFSVCFRSHGTQEVSIKLAYLLGQRGLEGFFYLEFFT